MLSNTLDKVFPRTMNIHDIVPGTMVCSRGNNPRYFCFIISVDVKHKKVLYYKVASLLDKAQPLVIGIRIHSIFISHLLEWNDQTFLLDEPNN